MSQHQLGSLERGREIKQKKEQQFIQPLNKQKSEQSVTISPSVKQKLQQLLLSRLHQVAPRDTSLATSLRNQNQDLIQSKCISNTLVFEEDNPLRRSVSEPILKVKPRRNLYSRPYPLQRKTSAPPAVRVFDTMGSAADKEAKNYGQLRSHEIHQTGPMTHMNYAFHQSIHWPGGQPSWPATHVQSQFLTVPPHVHSVPVIHSVMSHRPLVKANSAPEYIQQTHIHTQTLTITHPTYELHFGGAQEGVQHHILPNKERVRSSWSMSPGGVYKKDGIEKDYHKRFSANFENILFEPVDDSCTNEAGLQQPEECNSRQLRKFNRHFNKSLPSRLSPQKQMIIMNKPNYITGLVYDPQMLKHECDCGDNRNHPEHAGRIKSIWSRLQECGLRNQCELVKGRMAAFEELESVHLKDHVTQFTETQSPNNMDPELIRTQPCGGKGCQDMVWNGASSAAALKTAVGSVVELALLVADGRLRNGFAVVRPPGHHAAHAQTHGFSIFNSVAIAAKQLQERSRMKKILIVDWDIHHGSGTEKIFWTDPSVLYISLHRFDYGSFFPGTGQPNMVGSGRGKGYNVNVAWSGGLNPPMGDAEYLAAFRTVVMPIAHEFSPNVVLVSAGFDATEGHSPALGGYKVSAKCFGVLTQKLMELAEGRVVLVLEGGYDLTTLCDASQACVHALLGHEPEPLAEDELLRRPCDNAVKSLEEVLAVQSRYWDSVKSMSKTLALPHVKAERRYSAGSDAASALGGLTMTIPRTKCSLNEPMEHDEADSM
ncbi:histone deacetylase 4 [Misgurnus anguillicaudatus]|uniref:histone deacetylase 4 n=1 Tax=Misgurnus anguillicaudatus TaxID=75329 RepID=UPI003CCF8C93